MRQPAASLALTIVFVCLGTTATFSQESLSGEPSPNGLSTAESSVATPTEVARPTVTTPVSGSFGNIGSETDKLVPPAANETERPQDDHE
ncbi:MAG: hypothetical protein MK106_07535 [Mariniblastus sp.]|nr:hypothetical protein [Mariniblastus sp.]